MSAQTTYVHFHSNVFDLKTLFPPLAVPALSLRKPSAAIGLAEDPLNPAEVFARWVLALSGLDGGAYRAQPLLRRVPACLRALGVTSLAAARAKVKGDERARAVALGAFLVGVTEFYRDIAAFDELEGEIDARPEFFAGCRVWSAGCSVGAEGYTLAMMMHARGLLEGGQVVGTDCRTAALETARKGRYAPALCEGLPERYQRYMQTVGGELEVSGAIRKHANWEVGDLLEPKGGEGGFHLVACRNVSIYLNHSIIHGLWSRLYDSLLPGGVLFTGHAEIPEGCPGLIRVARCLYRKESRACQ
jgi:chemotaxis protein methyltransferase CheR